MQEGRIGLNQRREEAMVFQEKQTWKIVSRTPLNGSFSPDYGGCGLMVTITEAAAVGAVMLNVFPFCSGCQKAVESSRV